MKIDIVLTTFALLALGFAVINHCFAHIPQPFFRRGFYTDLFYIPIHYFMRVFVNVTLATALSDLGHRMVPNHWLGILKGSPLWVQAMALLLILDFIFYVTHRLKHRWRWWWNLHETHHSSTDVDWLSSVRFHPLEKLMDRTLYLVPLLVLGVSDQALWIWSTTDVFFGMFSHSNVNWRLGFLKYIFVGPEMHRWHHVRDPHKRECNFGNNFSIFDWVFGTAYISNEEPHDFGVDNPDYPDANIIRQFLLPFRARPGRVKGPRFARPPALALRARTGTAPDTPAEAGASSAVISATGTNAPAHLHYPNPLERSRDEA